MNLNPLELAVLHLAGEDEEGRFVVFDPNDGPLSVVGSPGSRSLELGEEGLRLLLRRGLVRFDGGHSYVLTRSGWRVIEKNPLSPNSDS